MKILKEVKNDQIINENNSLIFDKKRVQDLRKELNNYLYSVFSSYVEEAAFNDSKKLNKDIYSFAKKLKDEGWVR